MTVKSQYYRYAISKKHYFKESSKNKSQITNYKPQITNKFQKTMNKTVNQGHFPNPAGGQTFEKV